MLLEYDPKILLVMENYILNINTTTISTIIVHFLIIDNFCTLLNYRPLNYTTKLSFLFLLLANLSITSSTEMSISGWMNIKARPVKRSSVILFLK